MNAVSLVNVAPSLYAKAAHRFDQYQHAGTGRAAALIAAVHDFDGETPEQVEIATKGVIEASRFKDSDGKWQDGNSTLDARKFVSYARAIWGAVRLGRLPGFESFSNNETLVKAARAALSGKDDDGKDTGETPCDWRGTSDAERQAKAERGKIAKAFKEVASEQFDDDGELLTISPQQFAALQQEAKAKLSEKAAQKRLEKMEASAANIADRLLKDYGPDDAETVLKRAIEVLTARLCGIAS